MRIFKIGGSVVKSKQDFDILINKTIELTENSKDQNFFVFSAFSKTSAKLRQMAMLASNNEIHLALKLKEEILTFHKSLYDINIDKLYTNTDKALTDLIEGLSITSDLSKSILDKILHFGENIAIGLISSSLKNLNTNFYFLDAKSFLRTDSNYGEASPYSKEITSNLANLKSQFDTHKLIITQGFIGFDNQLAPTTMGFESSNLTATLLADSLNVKEINIISDVPALLSADPNYFNNTKVVEHLNYSAAKILGRFGLKLIYEKMIDLAEKEKITIKYSDLSQAKSTVISGLNGAYNRFVITNFDLACVNIDQKAIYTFTNGKEIYSFINKSEKNNSISYEYKLITLFGYEKANILKLFQNSDEIVNFNFDNNGFAALVVKEIDLNKVIQQIETTLL